MSRSSDTEEIVFYAANEQRLGNRICFELEVFQSRSIFNKIEILLGFS